MNKLNTENLYKNLNQLPWDKINELMQKLRDFENKLASDFKSVELKIPTMEKKFLEVKILFEIGVISSSEFIKFKMQLGNAQDLVANYTAYRNIANKVRIKLGKLNPPNCPRPNYMKSDAERVKENGPREPLCNGKNNKMENGSLYTPVPDQPLMGEVE